MPNRRLNVSMKKCSPGRPCFIVLLLVALCRYVLKNTSKKFQNIGSLWQPSVEQACWCHFPKSGIFKLSVLFFRRNASFPGGTSGREAVCQCRRGQSRGFHPWVGKIPGGGHGNPLWYSCLENPMDRGAWWATGHRIAKSWTQLKQLSMYAYEE